MSSTEPPAGSTPPPPEGSTPPPPPPAAPQASTPPPPPPPAGSYAAPAPGFPGAATGVGAPGNLLDRFLGRLLDSLIIGIPAAIVVTVLSVASDSWFVSNLIAGVVYSVAYLGYFGYMESNRGAGIGKGIMKLKVEGPNGRQPDHGARRSAATSGWARSSST